MKHGCDALSFFIYKGSTVNRFLRNNQYIYIYIYYNR